MPIPKPKPDESRNDFIGRCMEAIGGEFDDNDQAVAVCNSTWEEAKKSMSVNDQLLKEIKARQEKKTAFNYGILTADRWVKSVQKCIGSELCYRFACTKSTSFNDVLEKAAKTLTYSNPEMECEEVYNLSKFHRLDINEEEIELPKNTLLAFRHILTTPKKDRDGDIMRTQGAVVDPKMLMLWNHVHTLPIGKMIAIAEHTDKVLSLYSAIIDMNELSHDSAVMIESGMGRFSHGFRALDFEKFKEEQGRVTSPGGFDVKRFEIMEETLASVPSNTDAETQEIFLSLVEGGKLTSPIMKSFGKTIRGKRPIVIQNTIWIDDEGNISKENDDDKSGIRSNQTKGKGCGCGTTPCSCTSKETNANTREKEATTLDEKIIRSGMITGSWEYIEQKLGDKATRFLLGKGIDIGEHAWVFLVATFADHGIICKEEHSPGEPTYYEADWAIEEKEPEWIGDIKEVKIEVSTEIIQKMINLMKVKAGRVISKANFVKLGGVRDDLETIHKEHISTKTGKVVCEICIKKLDAVMKSAHVEEDERSAETVITEAMGLFLAEADHNQRTKMVDAIKVFDLAEKRSEITQKFRSLVGT